MSAYHEVRTAIKDTDVLVETLKEKFKTVEVHATAVQLEGYHGDKRSQTAEVVVPRQVVGHASNDIGFKKDEDGNFKAIISEYDKGVGYNDKWLATLHTSYVEKKTMKQAKTAGLVLRNRRVLSDGKIQMQFTKI